MRTILKAAARTGLVAFDGDWVRLVGELAPAEPAACPSLRDLVAHLELEHPHFPVPYGQMDPSFDGGPGDDWKPIPREPDSDLASLPMTALLSQALVSFGIEYENARNGPIQWAANLRPEGKRDGVGLPTSRETGVHSAPNLERLGIITIGPTMVVTLTPVGRAIRDAYEPTCHRIESLWRDRYGSVLIDAVIDAMTGLGERRPFPLIDGANGTFHVVTAGG